MLKICVLAGHSASSQVKFLTQEEEEARAVFGKKEAVLMEEISYLRENLSAERAALEAARAEGGHSGEQERQRYNRYVKLLAVRKGRFFYVYIRTITERLVVLRGQKDGVVVPSPSMLFAVCAV